MNMKLLEKVLATALFAVGALGVIIAIGISVWVDAHLLLLTIAILFGAIGLLSILYGTVRRHNLQYRAAHAHDRTSPLGQFFALGWGMLAVSVLFVGAKIFWLH